MFNLGMTSQTYAALTGWYMNKCCKKQTEEVPQRLNLTLMNTKQVDLKGYKVNG